MVTFHGVAFKRRNKSWGLGQNWGLSPRNQT